MSASFKNLLTAVQLMSSVTELPVRANAGFLFHIDNLDKLDYVRERYFSEEVSQKTFDWVQQYRIVSDFYGLKLPVELENTPFTEKEWKELEAKAAAMTTGFVQGDYILDRIDTWLLESYAIKGVCEAAPGDIVLDCGTFTGNTSLYFSQKVGASGHIYGFEASPDTFATYAQNMRDLANVTPVNAAVYDSCGTLCFKEAGPGGAVAQSGVSVTETTLDAFVKNNALTKVDFIKMDVEGAEVNALSGANEVIRNHLPKMALSAYHRASDLIDLPELVEKIAPGHYTFKLRHFSDCLFETVLFCIPQTQERAEVFPAFTSAPDDPVRQDYLRLVKSLFITLQNTVSGHLAKETPRLLLLIDKLNEAGKAMKELLETNNKVQKDNLLLRSLLKNEKLKNMR